MARPAAWAMAAIALAGANGCKRPSRGRVAGFTPPPLAAGFVEQNGAGWRIAVPSTWTETAQKDAGVWSLADPQTVDDFRANVNVVTEHYTEDSFTYARANEEALRHDPRASVETVREDVVDGDATLVMETRWAPVPPSAVAYLTAQTALASRGTGYVVTCSASAGGFERYRSTCEAILRSFAVER
ncbi:MAG TPA: hypothetical protein VKU41_31415 [Polyangiaceae bacterium]|nr:hypothetical protein [Polyangiaceae bacterium]